jgi:lipopolysaccharide-binding protein
MSSAGFILCASLLLLLLCSSCQLTAATTPPGLKVRLSQPALDYAANVVVEIMSDKVRGMSLPEVSGTAHIKIANIEYRINDMKVTNFQPPSATVTVNPGSDVTLSLNDASIDIHGNWYYKYKVWVVSFSHSGSFDASTSGISLSVSVTLGSNSAGEPTISTTGCSCSIDHLDVDVHGGHASFFYDIIMMFVEPRIRQRIDDQICRAVTDAINKDANKELSTMKVQVPVGKQWLLDYRLVSAPLFAAGCIESFHKGEFFYATDLTEAPFQPALLPSLPPTEHMVTFCVSEYVLDTAGYVFQKHGGLSRNFTRKDLPADNKDLLNTTCSGFFSACIGNIEAVKRAYPNVYVEIEMFADTAPVTNISGAAIVGIFDGTMIFRARLNNGSLVPLFVTKVLATVPIIPILDGTVLRANVTEIVFESVHVTESSIGKISHANLMFFFDTAAANLIPELSEAIKGFTLPAVEHVEFYNVGLKLLPQCLSVETDVRYKQKAAEELGL